MGVVREKMWNSQMKNGHISMIVNITINASSNENE
jgi:hypothetical protein